MSQEEALKFVGRLVTDKEFADRLVKSLSDLTDPSARAGRLAKFACGQGFEVTPDDLVPFIPSASGELADSDLERVAGGVGAPNAGGLALLCVSRGGALSGNNCVVLPPQHGCL